jgi:hypothetical protein
MLRFALRDMLAPLVAFGMLLLGATLRREILRRDREESLKRREIGMIYSLWHGRMFFPVYFFRGQKTSILVSQSRDGELITGLLQILGQKVIRGSSSRGGARALVELCRRLEAGQDVALTPDGPRGPRHRVQPGIIGLASRTGAPILPIAFGASRKKTFQSWDRFSLPLPFSRVALVFGPPVEVAGGLSAEALEEKRRELEGAMEWTTQAADAAALSRKTS